ncbi:hypothetical protein RN001_002995, partial [Aquatica leii]
ELFFASVEKHALKKGAVTVTTEQFRKLLLSVQQPLRSSDSTPTRKEQNGNFTTCTARSDGESSSSVEDFLDTVLFFKDCANMSNENAGGKRLFRYENAVSPPPTFSYDLNNMPIIFEEVESSVTPVAEVSHSTIDSLQKEIVSSASSVQNSTAVSVDFCNSLSHRSTSSPALSLGSSFTLNVSGTSSS